MDRYGQHNGPPGYDNRGWGNGTGPTPPGAYAGPPINAPAQPRQGEPQTPAYRNVWKDVWLQQFDPQAAARMQLWAQSVGQALNYNAPFRAQVVNASAVSQGAAVNGGQFDLSYDFPQFGFILRATATVRGLVFADDAPEIPTAFDGCVCPEQYVEAKIRRTNSEMLTNGGGQQGTGDGFIPLAEITGRGPAPYAFDLIQFFSQAERLTINCRLAPEVDTVEYVGVSFHILRLPVGPIGP